MTQNIADSEVGICNLALGHVKDPGIADLDQPHSKAARVCKKFYAVTRDALLEDYRWNFNTRRIRFTTADLPEDSYGFSNAYLLGGGIVRVLEVDGCIDEDWTVEDGLLLVDLPAPLKGRVSIRITEPAKYSAAFVNLFSLELAVAIGGEITHDTSLLTKLEGRAEKLSKRAKKNDAKEGREKLGETVSSYIAVRSV